MDKDTTIGKRPERREATAGVRRSGTQERREDVALAEDGVGAATALGRGPGRGFAVGRRDSCDTRLTPLSPPAKRC